MRTSAPLAAKLRSDGTKRSQSGFSVLELLLVVAVIVTMLAFAIPSYNQVSHGYAIRNDADNVAGLLTQARMRAASTFARARVTCDTTTKKCTLSTKKINGAWTNDPQVVTLSKNVAFGIPSGTTNGVGNQTAAVQGSTGQTNPYYVEFNSRGQPIDDTTGNAASTYGLYITDSSYKLSAGIGVDWSGKSSVYLVQKNAYTLVKE
jgi:Tfp pilus assembly protein FimT